MQRWCVPGNTKQMSFDICETLSKLNAYCKMLQDARTIVWYFT